MSNVYAKNLNVPPIARNKRIYTGTTSITNTTVTNTVEDRGGVTTETVEKLVGTRQPLHGFETAADSVLSFVYGTLTFTITGTDFKVWNLGRLLYRDTESIQILGTVGRWFIYYDDLNEITASQTAWDLTIDQPIATIDMDGSSGVMVDNRRTCYDTNHIRIVSDSQSRHDIDIIRFTAQSTPTLLNYNTNYAPQHGQFPRLELIIDNGDGTRYSSMQRPLFTTLTSGGGVTDLIDEVSWDLGEPLNGWIIIN